MSTHNIIMLSCRNKKNIYTLWLKNAFYSLVEKCILSGAMTFFFFFSGYLVLPEKIRNIPSITFSSHHFFPKHLIIKIFFKI